MQIQQENVTAIDCNNIPERSHQQAVYHVDLGEFHWQTLGDIDTGRFACGLAALNCVRTIFEKEGRGIKGEQLLREVLARETAQEINSICSYWDGPFHLDVEDIIRVPWFSKLALSMSAAAVLGRPMRCDFHSFMKLLLQMDVVSGTTESVALMITCPPEVVACLKIHTSRGDVFLIFESQFHPKKSFCASFLIITSMDATAAYLTALFNPDKHSSERDTSRQFCADTMRHSIGHILVPVQSDVDDRKSAKQTLLESSMTILKLNAELAAMKSEISSLATELETSQNTLSNLVENMRTRAHVVRKARYDESPWSINRGEKIAAPDETPHLPPPTSAVKFLHLFHDCYNTGASEKIQREPRKYDIRSIFDKLGPASVNGGGRVHSECEYPSRKGWAALPTP